MVQLSNSFVGDALTSLDEEIRIPFTDLIQETILVVGAPNDCILQAMREL